ncbi:MAG: YdeI/OmpD-associated family protein, partial [Candidatus Dormibacteraeota bacterium]|nr:YdeI/OmpD-associated family protein [Candidatus Dormibacteraeota bacterium]
VSTMSRDTCPLCAELTHPSLHQPPTFVEGLSYSNWRRLVMAIEGAKAADTRQRRLAKTVSTLREHRT